MRRQQTWRIPCRHWGILSTPCSLCLQDIQWQSDRSEV